MTIKTRREILVVKKILARKLNLSKIKFGKKIKIRIKKIES